MEQRWPLETGGQKTTAPEQIGMVWDGNQQRERDWLEMYRYVTECRAESGVLPISRDCTRAPNGKSMSCWITQRRSRLRIGNLSATQLRESASCRKRRRSGRAALQTVTERAFCGRENRMKKIKQQQGFTLVETIVACALLMMLISIFGSITIFTLNLSYREKEASQVEILADTLANRVDEILRDAQELTIDEDGIRYCSPKYPKYYMEKKDSDGNILYVEGYAILHMPNADSESIDKDFRGKLCVNYAGQEIPIVPTEYLLLPSDSYENMTASFKVLEKSGHLLRMNITLNGTKYHTSYSRDFTVLLPNCE